MCMDSEQLTWLLAVLVLGAAFIYKYWNKISKSLDKAMEDGTLSLDEALDIVEDVQEVVEEVKEVLDEVPSLTELKKLKKADLQALAEKHDLDTAGTKAEILDRLKALNND